MALLIVFPAVPVDAHLVERSGPLPLVADQVSRYQVVGVIRATLLNWDDVISTEAHLIFPRQAEIDLLAADSTQHARIAQLGPVGQVTDSLGSAHEESVADSAAHADHFRPARASGTGHRC
jgi:hypothetical protein